MTEFACRWDGDNVRIEVTFFGRKICFDHECEDEAVAIIVAQHIDQEMSKRIKKIRMDAYNAGKRAARGGPKVTPEEFNECINAGEVGWSDDACEWVKG